MKLIKTALLALMFFTAACDTNHRLFRDGQDGKDGVSGTSCHVTQTPTGANITCDDGSSVALTNGSNGHDGVAGARGTDGSSCSVMQALDGSGALISCDDDSNVFVSNGAKGDKGDTGSQGPQGNTGSPGMNATPVEFIKFCPGSVPSYGNFPEYGIKANGKVYAVYSANNGFLTLLSPGGYNTSSTGLNCNFTVHSDGSVSN